MDKKKTISIDMRQYGMVFALTTVFLIFATMTGGKDVSPVNINNLIIRNGYVVILAIGMLLCYLTGNTDLGADSIVALCDVAAGILMINYHVNMWVAILATLVVGAPAGTFVGLFVSKPSISSFIVALATMSTGRGLIYTLLGTQTKGPLPASYTYIGVGLLPATKVPFGNGTLDLASTIMAGTATALVITAELKGTNTKKKCDFSANLLWQVTIEEVVILMIVWFFSYKPSRYNDIPFVLIIMSVLIGLYHFITSKTVTGRQIYVSGGNAKTAKLSGINTEKVFFQVYTNMDILSVVAGTVLSACNASAIPEAGDGSEMGVIASCHIGGVATSDGIGAIIGVVVGAFIIGIPDSGMSLYGWSTDIQETAKGAVLLGVVMVDLLPEREKGQVSIMGTQGLRYKAVYNRVLENTNDGASETGEKLSSENEPSECFGLSHQMVCRAVDILGQQRLVLRTRGSGMYVGSNGKAGHQERHIGIIIISTYVDSYTLPPVVWETERVLSKKGYTTQITFTGSRVSRERDISNNLIDKGTIDGLITEPAGSALLNPNLHYHQELKERGTSILFFGSRYSELELLCMSMNDEQMGKKAVEYLIKNDHRNIRDVFKSNDEQGHLRCKGFLLGMLEVEVKVKDANMIRLDMEGFLDLNQWAGYLFRRLEGCAGMVCYSDEVAYVSLGLCGKQGITILDQLSVASINDPDLAILVGVKLIFFSYPMEALGREVAESMINIIENPYFDDNYLFGSDTIKRDSVRVLKQPCKEEM